MWNLSFDEGVAFYENGKRSQQTQSSLSSQNEKFETTTTTTVVKNGAVVGPLLDSQSSSRAAGPQLIDRIEKTKTLLFYSMIVCIMVYLLQSIAQLVFTEVYIAVIDQGGMLVLYDSYIIVIGVINSMSDFTPFLMCYIFHKSNTITRDILKEESEESSNLLTSDRSERSQHFEDSYDEVTNDVSYTSDQETTRFLTEATLEPIHHHHPLPRTTRSGSGHRGSLVLPETPSIEHFSDVTSQHSGNMERREEGNFFTAFKYMFGRRTKRNEILVHAPYEHQK